jgi:translin
MHRGEVEQAEELLRSSRAALEAAQRVLAPHPPLVAAGFLHDAEKEYAEAALLEAMLAGRPVATHEELGVGVAAWLVGLAEAASELRRAMLDRLRAGSLEAAEVLLGTMEDVYDLLVTVDYPDAITGGLRRATDALRGVVERSRGDLTTAVTQSELRAAIEHASTHRDTP